MARVTRLQLLAKIDSLAPAIRAAFAAAIMQVRSEASITALAALITAGRLDEAFDMLGIDAARFTGLSESVRDVFKAGGMQGEGELPTIRMRGGGIIKPRFDIRNRAAEEWLRNRSSDLVAEIARDQREAIRVMVSAGTELGRNPRETALDLVGRVGATGRRSGGVIGLTSQQAEYVANARAQLLSGDPEAMARYFTRGRRDARFDGIVQRAVNAGKPVSRADVDRITGRYADRLLQLRGETIARTEALNAFNSGRQHAFEQAIGGGKLSNTSVRKKWQSSGDDRVREAHVEMNGQEVGLSEPFLSPTGAQLMHPGDSSLGAGAEDIIACRCSVVYVIDQIAEVLRRG